MDFGRSDKGRAWGDSTPRSNVGRAPMFGELFHPAAPRARVHFHRASAPSGSPAFAMVLALRQRQQDAVVRMLNLNAVRGGLDAGEAEVYKVLIMDRFCFNVIAPLVRVAELRRHGVTLHLLLENERQPIPDVPAVYFVQATEENVRRLASDFTGGLYDAYHLNFSSSLPRPLLESLAAASVKARAANKVARVMDQYINFVSLGSDVFSLAQPNTYVALNDPAAADRDVEAAVARVVEGLFSVCATLGQPPIIRCPKGGAAEMIASELEKMIRDHVSGKGSGLFSDLGGGGRGGGGLSTRRPLLCLFDRNYDLATALQHGWTYQPLVHDALNMRLNRVDIRGESVAEQAAGKKSYDLEEDDPFWRDHGDAEFPKVAEEVEAELASYKRAMADINDKTNSVGADDADVGANTQNLVSAVASLPELQERKKIIDKHTNIATALLSQIKARGLDEYCAIEEDLLVGKGDKAAVMGLLAATGRGTPEDKLRLAVIYVMSRTGDDAMSPADAEALEGALRASGADGAALSFVKRMASLNARLDAATAGGAGAGAGDGGDLLDWADKLYGQSVNAVAKGVKSLLSGERRLPLARAVESLMANQPSHETESFALFDPKAPRGAPAPAPRQGDTPYHDAVVFVVGGGNYLEYQGVRGLARRDRGGAGGGGGGMGGGGFGGAGAGARRSVVYGATEFVTGAEFIEQLGELGRKTGR